MSPQPTGDRNPDLTARSAEVIRDQHGLAYARLTPDLVVVDVSDNFDAVVEIETSQMIGIPVTDLLWEFVGVEEELKQVADGETSEFRLEKVHRLKPDGESDYLDFIVLPIRKGDPAEGLLLVVENVTEFGNLEQALIQERNELRLAQAELAEANAALRHLNQLQALFLSVTAHDIRTPLTAIGGYTDLLLSGQFGDLPEKARDFLKVIFYQTDYLSHITGDLMDLNALEQGDLSLRLEKCNLVDVAASVSELMQFNAQRNSLSMEIDFPAEAVWVEADPNRLGQMLYNLLSNAIKYTPSGGKVQLQVGAKDGIAFFSVRDTGSGLTKEEQSNLFQLHYRTEGARRSKVRGAGLGLFIVKSLVDAHNGSIHVVSQPGQGSAFTVHIPLSSA